MLLKDKDGNLQPMVDRTGKFYRLEDLSPDYIKNSVNVDLYKSFAGKYVKNEYLNDDDEASSEETLDVEICVMLKQQGLVFKIEKYIHNYPHCWRTDKPVLYYPFR